VISGLPEVIKAGTIDAIGRRIDYRDRQSSLREQLEDAIDEHEGENGDAPADDKGKGDLSPVERQMLRNMLHFSEHDADDLAVPRGEIVAISAGADWAEVVSTFAEHGHSRMPVYRDTLDRVIGMVHIKDVFPFLARAEPPPADWTTLMRQPLYVPQTRNALDVLADMRQQRVHLAVVLDEFSGTDGLITIEDLVEEIVGDIEDEHDDDEPMITQAGDGIFIVDGKAEIDEVAKLIGEDFKAGEHGEYVDTIGGRSGGSSTLFGIVVTVFL